MTGTAVRRFTLQQAQIAQLIADPRALSYAQIGELLTPKLAEKTVKVYVQRMTEHFDVDTRDAHPPRVQVLVWVRQLQWELRRPPTIEEILEASGQRDV
jgi:DNA-binding NarL/FixJ family response regulator